MNLLTKKNKLFIKITLFLLNILCIGFVIGFATRFDETLFILSIIGVLGWLLLVMPLFFNHWGNWFIDLKKQDKHKKILPTENKKL